MKSNLKANSENVKQNIYSINFIKIELCKGTGSAKDCMSSSLQANLKVKFKGKFKGKFTGKFASKFKL